MGIIDKLKEEAKEFAEKEGRDLLEKGKRALADKAGELQDQATRKINVLVDEQKKRVTDKLPDILKK